MFVIEDFIVRHELSRMGCHAAHGSDQAGLGTAFHLVIGLVVANGIDQVVPFLDDTFTPASALDENSIGAALEQH